MIKDVFRYTAVIGVLLASTIFAGGCDYDEALKNNLISCFVNV